MDRQLRIRLMELVLKISGIEDYGTRTTLLIGIPNSLSLTRSHANARTDIANLINQLSQIQLQDGQWALFIFIENALSYLKGTMNGQQLEELHNQLESTSPAVEPNISAPVQTSPAKKSTSRGSFPNGYALIVGVASYQDQRLHLSEAIVKDTMDMHTILRAADYCGYVDNHVRLRYDSQATADTIRNDLKWLAEVTAADKDATAIFYFSGHGGRIEIDGQVSHYLLPFDCDLNDLNGTAITSTELAQLLHAIRPPRLLVLLDSCYAGGIDEIKGITEKQSLPNYGSEEEYYQQLAQDRGRVIIASSSPTETSRASSALNNSLFTHYLLKGLKGEATSLSPGGDGLIRVVDLFSYVLAQVPRTRPQHPVMTSSRSQNFPIALYHGGKQEQIEETTANTHHSFKGEAQ